MTRKNRHKGPGSRAVAYKAGGAHTKLTEADKARAIDVVRRINALKARGVSYGEVARAADCPAASVTRFVRGERYASREFVARIEPWLDAREAELLIVVINPPPKPMQKPKAKPALPADADPALAVEVSIRAAVDGLTVEQWLAAHGADLDTADGRAAARAALDSAD